MPNHNRTVYLNIVGRWVNKRNDLSGASSKHDTQEDAIKAAYKMLRTHGGELTVRTADGKIQSREMVARVKRPPPHKSES